MFDWMDEISVINFIILLVISRGTSQYQSSPCPGTFSYQYDQQRGLHGVIRIVNNHNTRMQLNVEMSVGNRVQGYNGNIELSKPKEEVIQDIVNHRPIQYKVFFPVWTRIPPQITKITLNGHLICQGPNIQRSLVPILTTINLQHTMKVDVLPLSYPTGPKGNDILYPEDESPLVKSGRFDYPDYPDYSDSRYPLNRNPPGRPPPGRPPPGRPPPGRPPPGRPPPGRPPPGRPPPGRPPPGRPSPGRPPPDGPPPNGPPPDGPPPDGPPPYDPPSGRPPPGRPPPGRPSPGRPPPDGPPPNGPPPDGPPPYDSSPGRPPPGRPPPGRPPSGRPPPYEPSPYEAPSYGPPPDEPPPGRPPPGRPPPGRPPPGRPPPGRPPSGRPPSERPYPDYNNPPYDNGNPYLETDSSYNNRPGGINKEQGEILQLNPENPFLFQSESYPVTSDSTLLVFQRNPATTTSSNNEGFLGAIPGTINPYGNICGKAVSTNALVLHGNEVPRGAYPWLVALFMVKPTGLSYICSGSLVSDRHVVTAAHCTKKEKKVLQPNELLMILGKLNIQKWVPLQGEKIIEPQSIHVHPDYKDFSSDADVAVLTLGEKMEFTQFIRPLCLWNENSELENIVGLQGTVVGWGKDENGDIMTEEPKQIQLPIVSQETCLRSSYQFQYVTSNRTFCAGFRNGSGPCNGDSGSGFIIQHQGRWMLRGIVSTSISESGSRTCDLKNYVVFTDASKFIDWIQSFLK